MMPNATDRNSRKPLSRRAASEPVFPRQTIASWWLVSNVIVVIVCAVLAGVGCSRPNLDFVPTEIITPSNIDRLTLVYSCKFADYSLIERMAEPPSAINNVAVDSQQHRLFLHRNVWTGLMAGNPVGVHTIDLKSGRQVHVTRIPARPDMTGKMHQSSGPSVFDVRRRLLFTIEGWEKHSSVASAILVGGMERGLFEKKFGDPHPGLMALNLEKDEPRLVACGVDWTDHPEVDNNRFLLQDDRYEPTKVMYLDRRTCKITATYSVPDLGPEVKQVRFSGGVGDYILAQAWSPRGMILYVMTPADSQLKVVNHTVLPQKRGRGGDAIDRVQNRWILGQCPRGLGGETQTKICVYEIPSLKLLSEWPDVWKGTTGWFLPEISNLIFTISGNNEHLLILDRDSGKEVARKSLIMPGTQDVRSWDLFLDPKGLYVGVYGAQWVHLFAIRPKPEPSQ